MRKVLQICCVNLSIGLYAIRILMKLKHWFSMTAVLSSIVWQGSLFWYYGFPFLSLSRSFRWSCISRKPWKILRIPRRALRHLSLQTLVTTSQTIIDILTPLTLIRKTNLLMRSSTRRSRKCELLLFFIGTRRKRYVHQRKKGANLNMNSKEEPLFPCFPQNGSRASCQMPILKEKNNILTNILFLGLFSLARPCTMREVLTLLGEGAVAVMFIYIHIHTYIHTYVNKLFGVIDNGKE